MIKGVLVTSEAGAEGF